jgi:hypothetical protein
MDAVMKALVVYESMFGNTHDIASCIADGLRDTCDVSLARFDDVNDEMLAGADVVVVGGPTHAHGLTGRRTRQAAREMAKKEPSLTLERSELEVGLRDWFKSLGRHDGKVAFAFDTRASAPGFLTGRASKGIARRLRDHGFHVAATKSFLVDKHNHLAGGETKRARAWGSMVGTVAGVQPRSSAA